jgi:putative transposase
MKLAHIKDVSRRRGHIVATDHDRNANAESDLVKRQFVAAATNQLWVSDMSHVSTRAGFFYLAVLIDVFDPEVVGGVLGLRMTSDLVITVLVMTLYMRRW